MTESHKAGLNSRRRGIHIYGGDFFTRREVNGIRKRWPRSPTMATSFAVFFSAKTKGRD